jgi:tetratricopeptide (TPR) repeat protein
MIMRRHRKKKKDEARPVVTVEDLETRAQDAYRSGRCSEAQAIWKEMLERDDLTPQGEVEARFWYGTALHGIGRFDEALHVLDPACFDPRALGASPHWVYRIATRAALIHIERASPLERIDQLLERIAEIAPHADDPRHSRLWVVRGRLDTARGRRATAVKAFERGLDASAEARHSFAATAPFRMMLPLMIDLGRIAAARRALEQWSHSGDPESFKHPHLPAFHADRLRASGALDDARRHAMFAVERSQAIEDLIGAVNAQCAFARISVLLGKIRDTRFALRALTTLDVYLGLACLHAGLPVPDPQFGGEFEVQEEPAQRVVDMKAALRALEAVARAHRRAEEHARSLDEAFETRFRQNLLRKRTRLLDRLRKRLARIEGMAPGARASANPQCEPGNAVEAAPAAKPRAAATLDPARAAATTAPGEGRLPISLECDGTRSRLVVTLETLADLGRDLRDSDRATFVPYPVGPDGRLDFDVWRGDRLKGTGRLMLPHEGATATIRSKRTRQAIFEVEGATTPPWLERLARRARSLESERCFARGKRALSNRRLGAASRHFDLATGLRPEWTAAWEASARSRLALGEIDAALEASLRALETDSAAPAAWQTLSRIYEAAERVDEAGTAREQARARSQGDRKKKGGGKEVAEADILPF